MSAVCCPSVRSIAKALICPAAFNALPDGCSFRMVFIRCSVLLCIVSKQNEKIYFKRRKKCQCQATDDCVNGKRSIMEVYLWCIFIYGVFYVGACTCTFAIECARVWVALTCTVSRKKKTYFQDTLFESISQTQMNWVLYIKRCILWGLRNKFQPKLHFTPH